jgi:hypothetical protein
VACLSNGAELFLEKPRTASEQESLFAALDEVMKFQPEEGFRGVLRKAGLTEIIQMECLGAGSSILEVKASRGQGRIHICEGVILHAEAGDLIGEPAFNFILALRGGEFFVRPFAPPAARTIEGSWEFLLMEAVRQKDEALEGAEAGTARVVTGGQPADAGAEAPSGVAVGDGSEAVESAAGLGTPPETELAAEGEPWVQGGVAAMAEAAASEPRLRRVIEEVFVCSQQGTLLHGWQVRNGDLWVNFFEFLSQKTRRLALGLPVGRFKRLEATDGTTRLAILIDDDRGVLVRSREERSDAAAGAEGGGG